MFPLVPELLPSFTLLNKAKRDDQLNIINSHLGVGHQFKNQDIYTAKAEDFMHEGLLYNIVRVNTTLVLLESDVHIAISNLKCNSEIAYESP